MPSDRRRSATNIEIKARRFVIATGSPPAVPPIPGLEHDALSHQRDRLRSARAAEASDRHRRRTDRAGTGAGVPPARRRGHRARSGAAARQGRSGMRRHRARRSSRARASPSAAASRSRACARLRQRIEVVLAGDTARRPSRAAICWSRPAGGRTSTGSVSTPPASSTSRAASWSTSGLRTTNRRVYAIGDVAGAPAVHPRRQLSRRPA